MRELHSTTFSITVLPRFFKKYLKYGINSYKIFMKLCLFLLFQYLFCKFSYNFVIFITFKSHFFSFITFFFSNCEVYKKVFSYEILIDKLH